MVLAGTPVLAAGLFLRLFDWTIGTTFFLRRAGATRCCGRSLFGSAIAPGSVHHGAAGHGRDLGVIPVFSRKPIFGYRMIAGSSIGIAILSMSVWTHHMSRPAWPPPCSSR